MKKIPKMCAKPIKAVKKLTPSQIDYNEEVSFAKRLVKGEVSLESYPYYKSYQKTINKEKLYLQGDTLVVGCGPLPLSTILINGAVGLDSSKRATTLATKVAEKCRIFGGLYFIHEKAETYTGYGQWDSILITPEAGDSQEKKQAVLDNIWKQIDEYVPVIIRSSNTDDFISVNLDKDCWTVKSKLSVFDGMSTSYVVVKCSKLSKRLRNSVYKKLLQIVCADYRVCHGLCFYIARRFNLDIDQLPELWCHSPNMWCLRPYQMFWAPLSYKGWETRIGWIEQAIKDTE